MPRKGTSPLVILCHKLGVQSANIAHADPGPPKQLSSHHTTMLRQSSSRSHRSRKLGPSHTVQAFLLIAVAIWIVYQLVCYSYGGRRRAVAVETDGRDGEPARRRLGRRGFVDFSAGHASGGHGVADSADDPLSSGDGEGDDEEQEPDEDDGGGDGEGADAEDGLAADDEEEDDDRGGFQSQNSSGSEDEAKTVRGGGTRSGFGFRPVNGTDTVRDGAAALPLNATDGAADGTAPNLSGSAAQKLKNTSLSVVVARQRNSCW